MISILYASWIWCVAAENWEGGAGDLEARHEEGAIYGDDGLGHALDFIDRTRGLATVDCGDCDCHYCSGPLPVESLSTCLATILDTCNVTVSVTHTRAEPMSACLSNSRRGWIVQLPYETEHPMRAITAIEFPATISQKCRVMAGPLDRGCIGESDYNIEGFSNDEALFEAENTMEVAHIPYINPNTLVDLSSITTNATKFVNVFIDSNDDSCEFSRWLGNETLHFPMFVEVGTMQGRLVPPQAQKLETSPTPPPTPHAPEGDGDDIDEAYKQIAPAALLIGSFLLGRL